MDTYQSHYCASEGAFLFSFVYVMYLNTGIVSYLYRKPVKSKLRNKLHLRMIFICVQLNLRDLPECGTMTVNKFFNVCPFDYTAVAESRKVGHTSRLTTPVGWLRLLQLTVLSRFAIAV